MFVHVDWAHLCSNMVVLHICGFQAISGYHSLGKPMSWFPFALLYFGSGLCGCLAEYTVFTWLAKGMVARDCLETTDVQTHHVAAKMGPVAMHEHANEDRGRGAGKNGKLETPLNAILPSLATPSLMRITATLSNMTTPSRQPAHDKTQ